MRLVRLESLRDPVNPMYIDVYSIVAIDISKEGKGSALFVQGGDGPCLTFHTRSSPDEVAAKVLEAYHAEDGA